MSETYESLLGRMTEAYQERTGAVPDDASDIGIRMRVLAKELAGLYGTVAELTSQLFPEESSGLWLDRHARSRGLERKGAAAATGVLRFSRQTPAPEEIPLPLGLVCATSGEPSVRYVTTRAGVLAAGQTQVELPAQAQVGGEGGNAAAHRVTVMLTPAAGIGQVDNPEPFTGGEETEGDDSLRERLLASYRTVSNGTNAAYYRQTAQSWEGITSARAIPRARGVGTVDVVVTNGGNAPAPAVCTALEAEFSREKEINVDVQVRPARQKAVEFTLKGAVEPGGDSEAAKARLKGALLGWLAQRPVGEPLYLAAVYPVAMSTGLRNLSILAPAGDVDVREDEVIVPGVVSITCEEAMA